MALILLPRDFTTGDVIPSGWANNISDNFGAVDGRTGGDPGIVDFFLVAASGTTGVWRYLQARDYRAGTIPDSAMANQKVNAFTTIAATFGALLGPNRNGLHEVSPGNDGPSPNGAWHVVNIVEANNPSLYGFQLACHINDVNELYVRAITNGTASPWRKVWHGGNAGGTVPNPTTFAHTVDMNGDVRITRAYVGAPTQGIIRLGNGSSAYLQAAGGSLVQIGNDLQVVGQLTVGTGITSAGDITAYRAGAPATGYLFFGAPGQQHYVGWDGGQFVGDGSRIHRAADFTIGTGVGQVPRNDNQNCPNLSAGFANTAGSIVDGAVSTPNKLADDVVTWPKLATDNIPTTGLFLGWNPAGAGSMAWQAPPSGSGGGGTGETPGILVFWEQASPPTGWSIDTRWSGRMIGILGGGFGSSLGGTGGAASHVHTTNISHGHGDTIGGSVQQGTTSAGQFNVVTPNPAAADVGHGHGFTKSGGVTALANPTNAGSSDVGHLPPFVALHLIKKS